jgi:hypothetical protein
MAGWTTNTPTTTVNVGTEVTVSGLFITITPAAGYSIIPENFMIGNGWQPPAGGVTNVWYDGGNTNFDSQVHYVTFTQDGANVLATPTFYPNTFDADTTINIDIDENPDNPVTQNISGVCARVQYPHSPNSELTVTSAAETVTNQQDGSSPTVPWVKAYKHYQNDLQNFLMFRLIVNPDPGYTILNPTITPSADIEGTLQAFSTNISTPTTGDNKIFTIYYTAPNGANFYTPCEFGNLFTIDYTEQLIDTVDTNTIHGVNVSNPIGYQGGETTVTVAGAVNTQYTMTIQNATTSHWYNFAAGLFQSGAANLAGDTGSKGVQETNIRIAGGDTSVDYNIVLTSRGSSTLQSGVPTSNGDLQIKQYGTNTITVTPLSEESGDFNTYSPATIAIKRPIRFTGDSYTDNEVNVVTVNGVTKGSSTKVDIISRDPNITRRLESGMRVTGSGIPHNTTIKDVGTSARNYITLSTAVNLTSATRLNCAKNITDVVPISFTIPPGSGKTLAVNSSNNHDNSVWGFRDVLTSANTDQIGSTSLKVNNSHGILENMAVTGTGIPANTIVSSVSYKAHTITLNQAHSGVANNHRMLFTGANNPKVKPIHVDVALDSPNIIITGYLNVPKITNSARVWLHLDSMITVSP